jgi:hypothetical protein
LRPVEQARTVPIRIGPIWESDGEDDFTWTNSEVEPEDGSDSGLDSVMSVKGSFGDSSDSGPSAANVFDEEEEVTLVSEDSVENDHTDHMISAPPAPPDGFRRSRGLHGDHSSELAIDDQPPGDRSSSPGALDPPTEDPIAVAPGAADAAQGQPDASGDALRPLGSCRQDITHSDRTGARLLPCENSVDADRNASPDPDPQTETVAAPRAAEDVQASPRALRRFTIEPSVVVVSHSPRSVRRK